MLSNIIELTDHMFWADSHMWEVTIKLEHHKEVDSLLKLLVHLHLAQYAFLNIFNNQSLEGIERVKFDNLNDLSDWKSELKKNYKVFLSTLSDEKLEQIINIPWAKKVEEELKIKSKYITLFQALNQVIMHSTYHRGQVVKKIRELGEKPPLTDYIYWLLLGKPK